MDEPLTECPTCGEDLPTAEGDEALERHKLNLECLTLEACVCGNCKGCPDGYHHNPLDWPCICTPDCALQDEEIPT